LAAFKDRTGERKINNYGHEMTIVRYRGNKDIDVYFLNAGIVEHITYRDFNKGSVYCPMIIQYTEDSSGSYLECINPNTNFSFLCSPEDEELARSCMWNLGGGGYAYNKRVGMFHRIVMQTPDELETDHINGKRIDNRRENLRVCTASENQMNKKKPKNNTSGFKGVSWEKRRNKFVANIYDRERHIFIGRHATAEEAGRAYDKKAIELFGRFAKLNFPKEGEQNS